MSPTMTEGTISEWKVKEGEAFAAGDLLLSLETDKASIDVEAQDDGVMGKILVENGAAGIPVGKLIAILAEEGDDLASIEVPSEDAPASSSASADSSGPSSSTTPDVPADAPTPSPKSPTAIPSAVHSNHHPHHPKPLLPSVLRMLVLNGIEDASNIKGTGHHGVLTKGDVLAFLGKISNPRGSLPEDKPHGNHPANYYSPTPKDVKEPVQIAVDGPTLRRMIASGLGSSAAPKPASPIAPPPTFSFDSILDDYLPPTQRSSAAPSSTSAVPPPTSARSNNAFDSLLEL
ncbi:pyridoxine biosynthesis protein [Rhodotorula sphaerocarpa]